eukprot:238693-Lingulodinium_polyedra.AAC.1
MGGGVARARRARLWWESQARAPVDATCTQQGPTTHPHHVGHNLLRLPLLVPLLRPRSLGCPPLLGRILLLAPP